MEATFDFYGYRRINERKNYKKEVSFSKGSMIFPAMINNLSMGGARVGTRSIPIIKTGVEIIISIPYAKKQGCMKRKAIVMWVENDQFGIQFNRRVNERKNYKKEASFFMVSMLFPAKIKNLSMGGARVGTRSIPKIKTGVEITISIPFAKKQGHMKRKAIVRWAVDDQFGIQFI